MSFAPRDYSGDPWATWRASAVETLRACRAKFVRLNSTVAAHAEAAVTDDHFPYERILDQIDNVLRDIDAVEAYRRAETGGAK